MKQVENRLEEISAQFEVNLPTEELQVMLEKIFNEFTIIKSTVQEQNKNNAQIAR